MVAKEAKSKKLSDVNLKQPDTLVFFVDRNLGNKVIVNALRQEGIQVEVHDDHFPQGAKDKD